VTEREGINDIAQGVAGLMDPAIAVAMAKE